jgi:hypothetical protein
MSLVICKLPKAGLGNQMFPLLKAYVFAHLNRLPVLVTNYHHIKVGPYLRREKNKRKYRGLFNFQRSVLGALWERRKLVVSQHYKSIEEPPLSNIGAKFVKDTAYLFSAIPFWENYFDGLKENRAVAIELLKSLVRPEVLVEVNRKPTPVIGLHVRLGDFRKLRPGEDFSKVGAVRTPETYFIEIIQGIRKIHGTDLKVSLFTDGRAEELAGILSCDGVELVNGNSDLADLLLLSRSNIIVTSAGSTFSYWAGFLSGGILLMHPDHLHEPIRPEEVNELSYEGIFNQQDQRLVNLIRSITVN